MSEQERLEMVADILDREIEEVNADTQLDEIGWDSMGMLSVIALAKTNGKTITGVEIRGFKTVGDILNSAF